MLQAAEHGQARAFLVTLELQPDTAMNSNPHVVLGRFSHLLRSCSGRLAGLLAEHLTGIADSFILVRIGRTQRADVRGHLSYALFVVAAQNQMRLLVDLEVHALWQQQLDGVRIAQSERRYL